MKKTIIEGIITISLFFVTWFVLTQIKWVSIFRVQKLSDKTEEKLGELFWEMFQKTESENLNQFVVSSVDSIVNKICLSNKIERETIKVHILDIDDVNAFALPNGHLIVNSGLILNSNNQEEFSGVICHEIAHIELNHVMKKLVTEVGLSVLISMATSTNGSEIIKKTAKMLSTSAFDRNLEKEADLKAVDYLLKAKINPEFFANFLYNLSSKENKTNKYLTWMNTHPESKERAEYIIEYSKNKKTIYEEIVSIETWNRLKVNLQK